MQTAFAGQTAMNQGFNSVGTGIADLKYTVATENCADRASAYQNTRDEITHSLKSIKTIMAMMDSEYSNDEYSREGYSRGNSYARRRRRDSMGRYASDGYSGRRGYSRDDNMISELRGLMEDAPDERTRQEFQRLISKMENM